MSMVFRSRSAAAMLAATFAFAALAFAAAPLVLDHQKISDEHGGFDGELNPEDAFGWSVEGVGDLNGDGVEDIAVGSPGDDDGDPDAGAIWILFMRANGTVLDQEKISDVAGEFDGVLDAFAEFGTSIAAIGDLDGDGVTELAIGSPYDDDGDLDAGAVWIVFLAANAEVKDFQKISDIAGDFAGTLLDNDLFGYAVEGIGDLDGDGVEDVAVGAPLDDDGDGVDKGAVWILFLNDDGTVKDFQKISEEEGGFGGDLTQVDAFGNSIAALGDLDGDGVTELAVGAPQDDDGGGSNAGAVWVLFLNADGTVKHEQKISDIEGNFEPKIDEFDLFGWGVAPLGDVDGDGVADLAVGNPLDDDGAGEDKGALFLLLLNADGTVKETQKISEEHGEFRGDLEPFDTFATSVASIGDLNDDGTNDLVVGAPLDNDGGGVDSGAVWVLLMKPPDPICGDADENGEIVASDALDALRTAVGTGNCRPCACDTDESGSITASDAQRILREAVGATVELQCPVC